MFFFVVGGVKPRAVALSALLAQACPSCGARALREERIDRMLSLFFLDVYTLSSGKPYTRCGACGWTSASGPPVQGIDSPPLPGTPRAIDRAPQSTGAERLGAYDRGTCPACASRVELDFAFCPFCGQALRK